MIFIEAQNQIGEITGSLTIQDRAYLSGGEVGDVWEVENTLYFPCTPFLHLVLTLKGHSAEGVERCYYFYCICL